MSAAMLAIPSVAKIVARRILGLRVKNLSQFVAVVQDKHGIEIGGPSTHFEDAGVAPIYRYAAALDNVQFSADTIWGNHAKGQFICEGSELRGIPDSSYDFVLSSHCLEHIANPIKALREWKRVLKPDASLILILPHYKHTFDHRRKPTALAHMVDDFVRGVDETDLSHLPEILELHDLSRDPEAGTPEQFRERCYRNASVRAIHHHVFDEHNSAELLAFVGFSVVSVEVIKPFHIVLLAVQPSS